MNHIAYTPEFTKRVFDSVSGAYDKVNLISSFGFSDRWRRQMLRMIPQSDRHIRSIDLLSGMGETWQHIKDRFPGADITAIDFSEEMSRHAQQKNKKHFNGYVSIYVQDVLQAQLPDNYYDIVICAFGLKSFEEKELADFATLTHRILKPGGHFAFIESSMPPNLLLRYLYSMHIRYIVPTLGRLLGNTKEFKMLWHYTSKYKNSRRAAAIFSGSGLALTYDSYFFGCATGFHGTKT